jgi:4-amino-4-deoxy-L-arabinose transferase-like glycosyltransferase
MLVRDLVQVSSRRLAGLPVGVWLVASAVPLVLLALAGSYGFHRDEMYFILAGRHPDFGYVDQPPLTPLLSAAATQLLGTSPVAIRILPALVGALGILVCASMARRFGAGATGQVLAAVVLGGSFWLGLCHLDATATFDTFAWTLALWILIELMAAPSSERRWRAWLALGLVMGIALENKTLPVFLAAGLAGAVIVYRRWDILRSPGLWLAIAVSLAIWAPNLIWQAQHGFPQMAMAQHLAEQRSGVAERLTQIVDLALLSGPLLWPVPAAGLIWLLRAPEARSWRPIGAAFLLNLVLMLVTGGKSYYSAGFIPVLIAGGSVGLERRLAAFSPAGRWLRFGPVAATSTLVVALVALPLIPPRQLHTTIVPELYPESVSQLGWPEMARQVEGVVARLSEPERAHSAIIASNYGVYGALELFGHDLPPVYSGHNSVWYWGRPNEDTNTVIFVAVSLRYASSMFSDCRIMATIDNGYDLPSLEQGSDIVVCSNMGTPWSVLWPMLKHVD